MDSGIFGYVKYAVRKHLNSIDYIAASLVLLLDF